MQKKSYITPTLRIKEVQLTLLETMSGRDQGSGYDEGRPRQSKRGKYDFDEDEFDIEDFDEDTYNI